MKAGQLIEKLLRKQRYTILALFVAMCQQSMAGTVCYLNGNVESIIPSEGDVAIIIDTGTEHCTCDNSVIGSTAAWIDIDSDAGKAMYSAALSASMTGKSVLIAVEDGLGEGAAGNDAITYRFWLSCKLKSIEFIAN